MALSSIWRRTWTRRLRRGGGDDADGGGGWPLPTDSYSTSSGSTHTASTTTTSGSAGKRRPRVLDRFMALPMAPVVEGNAKVEKMEHLKGLVVEFLGDNRSSGAVQRWLSELDVGWVVDAHLAPGTHESSGHPFEFLVESWILALRSISESILTSLGGWCSQKQDQDEGTSKQPSASEFAQLVHATVLKMLPFVDIAAAKTTCMPGAVAEKLQVLIQMHDALSMASEHTLSLQAESTERTSMGGILSAYVTKLDDTIWDAVVEMRNNIMACTWTYDGDGSTDIHKVTHSIVSFTKVLWGNYQSLNRILRDAALRGEFVSENQNLSHVNSLIRQIISSLERKPSTKSSQASLPNESLRFLFLINNIYYLMQEFLTIWFLGFTMEYFTDDINYYINRYLHVSWEPVLKCLHDPATTRCFTRHTPPLPKFESEFRKTCAAQKFWKVPDPEMRKRLRKAIVDKVIPVFTQFLEDNSIATPPGFTPMEVEKMLGELFEG